MEGISLIESKELDQIKRRLDGIEQNQLALMKMMQQFVPQKGASNVPDFFSIADACKKYHISTQTLYNKMRLFKDARSREIDRVQAGSYFLINEYELQDALRLRSNKDLFFSKDKLRKAV